MWAIYEKAILRHLRSPMISKNASTRLGIGNPVKKDTEVSGDGLLKQNLLICFVSKRAHSGRKGIVRLVLFNGGFGAFSDEGAFPNDTSDIPSYKTITKMWVLPTPGDSDHLLLSNAFLRECSLSAVPQRGALAASVLVAAGRSRMESTILIEEAKSDRFCRRVLRLRATFV